MEIELIIESSMGDKEIFEPSQVEIKEKLGQPITYTLTFSEDVCDDDFLRLRDKAFNPLADLTISVRVNGGDRFYLVKGPVQGHQISLVHGGQGSKLVVHGSDNSVKLGWKKEPKTHWKKDFGENDIKAVLNNKVYTFSDFSIMKNIKKKKKASGGDESAHVEYEEKQVQTEDDLTFIKKMASQKGMYFWVSYETESSSSNGKKQEKIKEIAHFDALPLEGTPSQKLILNGDKNNIDSFEISWDANRPTSVEGKEVDIHSKKIMDGKVEIAPQPKLGDITLKDLTGGLYSSMLAGPAHHAGKMQERNKAALNDSEWFIKANCSTSFDRFCENDEKGKTPIIHAHTLIELTGAGKRYDGNYVVSGITHSIDHASYKMQLELMRNAWTRTTEEIKKEIKASVSKNK